MLQVLGKQHDPIYTLELPWKENEREVSCIPAGIYKGGPHSGRKYKDCFGLREVPGRSGILIHSGNVKPHTKGCILPGMSAGDLDGVPAVLASKRAMLLLYDLLGNLPFVISVRDTASAL